MIKNVAGYDLAKLFTGSFGTLGPIVEVALRLHPLPPRTATAVGRRDDPAALAQAAARAGARRRSRPQSLDVRWEAARDAVLARFAGGEARRRPRGRAPARARRASRRRRVEDDDALWASQRAAQRRRSGVVVRVSGVQTQLADQSARPTGRGRLASSAAPALGLSWLAAAGDAGGRRRARCGASSRRRRASCSTRPPSARAVDAGARRARRVELMRRVKERFDPAAACNPGVFVGGI